jgi:hypothetical protein
MTTTSAAGDSGRTDLRAWALGWLGGPVIGIANGALRRAVYDQPLGEPAAHQVSTVTVAGLLGAYVYQLDRRRPIATGRDAALIGGAWAGLTAAFEFGFGHYVAGASWATLRHDYDVAHGRIWGLVLLTLAAAPVTARAARLHRIGGRR